MAQISNWAVGRQICMCFAVLEWFCCSHKGEQPRKMSDGIDVPSKCWVS